MSEIDVLGTGKKVKCKYFSNTFSGGISIFKRQLASK